MDIAVSVNGVPIRLPDERWHHIILRHTNLANYKDDVLDVVEHPDFVYVGDEGALIAIRNYGRKRFLGVFYKEISQSDGFIITARFLRNLPRGRKRIWQKF